MAPQKNRMFREACLLAVKEFLGELQKIRKWIQGDWVPVWSDVYNMTHTFNAGNGIPLGTKESLGIYVIRYIPTGDAMYVGQGVIWERKTVHRSTFLNLIRSGSMEQLRLDKPHIKSYWSEGAEKMFIYDGLLENWSFECCVVDSKILAKHMETVWKNNYKPPFCVKGHDVT